MLDTGIKERIERKGIETVEVAGWRTRSAGSYGPRGSVNHHTAGGKNGAVPSLATVIFGRTDVPGPLVQVLQSREPVGWDKAYLIAAGRANHAGKGGWNGLSGNSSVGGLEVEHVGTGTVSVLRLEVSARIQAALLEAPGSSRDAGFCCQHAEWAPTRKVDFRDLSPWNVHTFRQRVAFWIGRQAEEDDMFDDTDKRLLVDTEDRVERGLILLRDNLFDPTAHPKGRSNAKSLIQGAVLDGLRETTTEHPERGVLRAEIEAIVGDVVEEKVRKVMTDILGAQAVPKAP
jgi:hypothetical protein